MTKEEFEARLGLYPLYTYAAQKFGHHVCTASIQVEKLVLDFIESESKVHAAFQSIMINFYPLLEFTGAHFAAYHGLEEAMLASPGNEYHPDREDGYGKTPLSWAAENGKEAVVKMLLAKDDVDPDSKDFSGRTPLRWAAENGHEAVVKLLLAKDGVDPDSKDSFYYRTPLSCAAEKGYEAVVKLLLAKDGVDPDSKDPDGTPLLWALENGHEAVVKLLLAKDGVDPDSKDFSGRTPLWWAVENGHGGEAAACQRWRRSRLQIH